MLAEITVPLRRCLVVGIMSICAAAAWAQEGAARCALPSRLAVSAPEALYPALSDLKRMCAANDCVLTVEPAPGKAFLRLELSADGTPAHPQGYLLEIDGGGIVVRSRACEGLFNGVQALGDLLRRSADGKLPECRIAGTAGFEERAFCFSLADRSAAKDMVRLKQRLQLLAALRCNRVIVEFGDNFPYPDNKGGMDEATLKDIVAFAGKRFIGIIPMSREWRGRCPRQPEERKRLRAVILRQCDLLRPKEYFFQLDRNDLEKHRRDCRSCRDVPASELMAEHRRFLAGCAAEAGVRPVFLAPDDVSAVPVGKPDAMLRAVRDSRRNGSKRFIMLAGPHLRNGDFAAPLSYTTPMFLGGLVRGCFAMWSPERPEFPADPVRYFHLVHTGRTSRRAFRTATPVAIWGQLTGELGSTGRFPVLDDRSAAALRSALRKLPERFEIAVCFGGRYYGALLSGDRGDGIRCDEVEIPLGGVKAGGVALLLSCSPPQPAAAFDPAQRGGKAFSYFDVAGVRIRYADGKEVGTVLKYRRHLSGWDEPFGGYDRHTALTGEDAQKRRFRFDALAIANPHPDKPIAMLIFKSYRNHRAAPVLLALSLLDLTEGKPPRPELADELLRVNFLPPPSSVE